MPKVVSKTTNREPVPATRPSATPEGRESQLVAKAMNLAERQLDDGTASSQVITHFLKLATENAKLERTKLEHEIELSKAKTENLKSVKHSEELFEEAIRAMMQYGGSFNGGSDDED